MANMSYCRFENTLRDFQDCAIDLEARYDEQDDSELSLTERFAKKHLIQACLNLLTLAVEARDPDLDTEDLAELGRVIKEFLR